MFVLFRGVHATHTPMRKSLLPAPGSEHRPPPCVSARLAGLQINNLRVREPAYEDLPALVRDPALLVLNPLVREILGFISDELSLSSLFTLR